MIPKRLNGLAVTSLLLLLTGCASNATRTEKVYVPAPVPVRAELVAQVPEPELPDGPLTNDMLAEYLLDLKEWGRGAYKKLAEIKATHPVQE